MGTLVDIAVEGMTLEDIQNFYNRMCKKYQVLSVKAFFIYNNEESLKRVKRPLNYKGIYIERPFRKIYLKAEKLEVRTVYHELFHHLNPHLNDGPNFERLLDKFMLTEYL